MEGIEKLKKFGIILAIILFLIGAINLYRNNVFPALVLWIIDLFVIVAVVLNPVLLKPFYASLLFVSHKIGWINTRLLLIAVYYFIFFPMGLIMRILRKDPLNRKLERQNNSYWILCNKEVDSMRCERQF